MLAPAWGRQLVPNQTYGDIVLDEIPGLSLALARPGEQIDLTVRMLDGAVVAFTTVVPEINSSLCLKVLSWGARFAEKDAVDVWRLLHAHGKRIFEPVEWSDTGVQGDSKKILRSDFARPAGGGVRAATTDRAEQAEVRALTLAVLRA